MPMLFGGDQGAVVVLAVNLDQRCADLAEQRDADGLVVDEGAGLAVDRSATRRRISAPPASIPFSREQRAWTG